MKKLQDQKHDMEREIKILHRKLRVSRVSHAAAGWAFEGRLGSHSD